MYGRTPMGEEYMPPCADMVSQRWEGDEGWGFVGVDGVRRREETGFRECCVLSVFCEWMWGLLTVLGRYSSVRIDLTTDITACLIRANVKIVSCLESCVIVGSQQPGPAGIHLSSGSQSSSPVPRWAGGSRSYTNVFISQLYSCLPLATLFADRRVEFASPSTDYS